MPKCQGPFIGDGRISGAVKYQVVLNKTKYPPEIALRILKIGIPICGRDNGQVAPSYLSRGYPLGFWHLT